MKRGQSLGKSSYKKTRIRGGTYGQIRFQQLNLSKNTKQMYLNRKISNTKNRNRG